MFERWLACFGETVGELFTEDLADILRLKARRIAESLRLGLFYRPSAARTGHSARSGRRRSRHRGRGRMMRLTTYTDYTLRTLIYLALEPERLARIAEIAKAYGISENHLMKVVHQLGVAGYVETIRGKNGGLRLAVRPEAINLGAVVRRVEPDLDVVPCFSPSGTCRIRPVCALKGVLGDALGAFLAVLDRYTLADLVAPRKELAGLLGVSSISVETTKSSTRRNAAGFNAIPRSCLTCPRAGKVLAVSAIPRPLRDVDLWRHPARPHRLSRVVQPDLGTPYNLGDDALIEGRQMTRHLLLGIGLSDTPAKDLVHGLCCNLLERKRLTFRPLLERQLHCGIEPLLARSFDVLICHNASPLARVQI